MAKLKVPLIGLGVSGTIGKAFTFLKRSKHTIVEKKPEIDDVKSLAQLSWRHMYQKAVALWYGLSVAEKQEWESLARPKHMTGFAWFISQALKPNPGLYLPLQGGTMTGIINMNGYQIEDLKDPVAVQDADTKAARDAAIAAAIGGSLTCDIYGFDGTIWQKLLVATPAFHNLRVWLYDGANAIHSRDVTDDDVNLAGTRGMFCNTVQFLRRTATRHSPWSSGASGGDASNAFNIAAISPWVYNGASWDRLRAYPVGTLKVGRAEIGLSTPRLVAAGQVKAAAGQLYWMAVNPSAGLSVVELSDDLDGLGAVVFDHFHTSRESHIDVLDPPMEFSTGIRLKTFTNMTSVIFGYK